MLKTFLHVFSSLFPGLFERIAYAKLTNPQVKKLRAHEQDCISRAYREVYKFRDFDIQTYRWGSGPNSVLLIHGWEGQAGNFADLIEKLTDSGYTVFAFDGPSHGASSQGKTSLFEFTVLVGEMIRKFGVKKLVSHSFGGVATTYALFANPDIEIKRYVLLTTPDTFIERIDDVMQETGLSEKVKTRLIARIESEIPYKVSEIGVSLFVQSVHVEKALIIHDKNDRVLPIERSRNVQKNWPNCEMDEISGTGHFKILRTAFVLNRVERFLSS